jgi:putative component of membrane protein insertase Oxa1/YidC/SpoIIIJ protein YidD
MLSSGLRWQCPICTPVSPPLFLLFRTSPGIFQQCRHLCSCSSGPRQVSFSSVATFVPALQDLARYSSAVSPPLFLLFWTSPGILQQCRHLCSCSFEPRLRSFSIVATFVPALQDLARYLIPAVSPPLSLLFRTSPGT